MCITRRTIQDEEISKNFLQPWSATLNSSLQAANKSRANVKTARIQLDALRGQLKSATGGPRQEQVRLEGTCHIALRGGLELGLTGATHDTNSYQF